MKIETAAPPLVRAPRGKERTCKTWGAEAALRLLMNNLDPEVAEDPARLVVYGGSGKAARDWRCYHAIVKSLRELAPDETLHLDLVTHDLDHAIDRALAAKKERRGFSIGWVGNARDLLERLLARGVVPDLLTDQTSAHDMLNGYVPAGMSLEAAVALRK